jgi:hypothetical protein
LTFSLLVFGTLLLLTKVCIAKGWKPQSCHVLFFQVWKESVREASIRRNALQDRPANLQPRTEEVELPLE